MDKFELFEKEIAALEHEKHAYLPLGEEAGAVVYRLNEIYILFEIPQYGGAERFGGISRVPKEIVDIVRMWT